MSSDEIPTPNTDEASFGTGQVSVDFARRMEREKAEAIEIARIAINAIETIYGHAQWCGQCQSFEIAKQCRDELHGFDRLNSLENDGLIQEASNE